MYLDSGYKTMHVQLAGTRPFSVCVCVWGGGGGVGGGGLGTTLVIDLNMPGNLCLVYDN